MELVQPAAAHSLDDCANELLERLDPGASDVIREYAQEAGVGVWQVLAGIIRRAWEDRRISETMIDPSWDSMEPVEQTAYCPPCGQTFKPARRGQVYCCNACGSGKPHLCSYKEAA